MIPSFRLGRVPRLIFGAGASLQLPSLMRDAGSKVLVITGRNSLKTSTAGVKALQGIESFTIRKYTISSEPSPIMVDEAVELFGNFRPDLVLAIGGGSVLDAGKAISAMLPLREGVKQYLEGVGTKTHPGAKVPFIAVPTTAGTGSEATKNAVLSETGENGFKRSLRHDNFVPDIAVIDAELTTTCPPQVTAASGMDAFTQLLESYVSTSANVITDGLSLLGLQSIHNSLPRAYHHGDDLSSRSGMALAAYLSGITLANAGLGLVHGFASSVGSLYPISHGVICSTLMYPANKVTVRKLRAEKSNPEALKKYATAGKLFCSDENNKSEDYYIDHLIDLMARWQNEFKIPSLRKTGVSPHMVSFIARNTENKNNPVELNLEERTEVLERALD